MTHVICASHICMIINVYGLATYAIHYIVSSSGSMTHGSEHVDNMRVSSALWAGQYIADHYIADQQIQISTLWGSVETCRYGAVIFRACG